MSTTVEDHFQAIGGSGGEVFSYLTAIIDSSGEVLLKDSTAVYANTNQRRLFGKGFLGGGVSTDSLAWVQVLEQRFKFSADRSKMDIYYSTTNSDLKVEIKNPDDTHVASVEHSGASVSPAVISSSLTAGSTYVAKVFIKVPVSGNARLDTIRGVERVLTEAELPT